jgi:hypothetical protein
LEAAVSVVNLGVRDRPPLAQIAQRPITDSESQHSEATLLLPTITVWIHDDRFAALSLGQHGVRQSFLDNQPEPEPVSDLCQQVRDNHRLIGTGHSLYPGHPPSFRRFLLWIGLLEPKAKA